MKDCCAMWHVTRAMKEKDFVLFLAYVANLKVPGSLPPVSWYAVIP